MAETINEVFTKVLIAPGFEKDGLQVLLDPRVRAVVQPGGSVRDEEVFQAASAARAAGITMYFTGERHFFHQEAGFPREPGERG